MISVSNEEFILALFKDDAPFCHVTDFEHDPSAIPTDQHLIAWKGDWASRYKLTPGYNQYFTISIFAPDDQQVARRRKANFLRTRVIVLDDVREKITMDAANKMPQPSWILESSNGSEQWGYILTEPCEDRARVENLLDGLVANGLAPDGKDPGMKGVTRYVRLPEGANNKASKLVNGQPFNCRILGWNPDRTATLDEIAEPFFVNLDAIRRESRVDGAANIPDHPLLQIPDIITVKEVRSDGRFDITCPWVDEHTGGADDGTAIFTNDDGSIGFKCHHGACQTRTARNLTQLIESRSPGFNQNMSNWQTLRAFAALETAPVKPVTPAPDFTAAVAPPPPQHTISDAVSQLRMIGNTTKEAREKAALILQIIDSMPAIEKQHHHTEVCDIMSWTKVEFKAILKNLREEWYAGSKTKVDFTENVIFIKEQNRLYDFHTEIFYTPEAFQNSFAHLDADARKTALQEGRVRKVDKLDFAPKQPQIFEEHGIIYGNTWCQTKIEAGIPGDVQRWLDHWDAMGWTEHRDHHLKWMAYTLQHPERKINHALILGGLEGSGKDFLLTPLTMAMGVYSTTIDGDELLGSHNEYIMSSKYVHINETELGDHHQAQQVSARLKRMAAAPPHTIRVNPKGIRAINIRNIVNITMSTNSRAPIRLTGASRRLHAAWSDLDVRDEYDNMLPAWEDYWVDRWHWMEEVDGWKHCVHYLMNCVDISKFNPGAPPPMTDFLREIKETSKSPAQSTVEEFISKKIGVFASDIITAADAVATLKVAVMTDPDLYSVESGWFTVSKLGRVFNDISHCRKVLCKHDGTSSRLIILRNNTEYSDLTRSELYREYESQIKGITGVIPVLTAVPQKSTIA